MRNIDLSLSNMTAISYETLYVGTSDHWLLILTCENVSFDMKSTFSHTNGKTFEAILVVLETFWIEEIKSTYVIENNYCNTFPKQIFHQDRRFTFFAFRLCLSQHIMCNISCSNDKNTTKSFISNNHLFYNIFIDFMYF
jgi:hypothetical protein